MNTQIRVSGMRCPHKEGDAFVVGLTKLLVFYVIPKIAAVYLLRRTVENLHYIIGAVLLITVAMVAIISLIYGI